MSGRVGGGVSSGVNGSVSAGRVTAAERTARAVLSRLVEPGSAPVARAVAEHGAEVVCDALRRGRRVGPLSEALVEGAAARASGVDPERDLEALARAGGRLVCPGDEEWPGERLSWPDGTMTEAPPLALYVRGAPRLDEATALSAAVVGARAATAYGVHVARELGLGLSERGVGVVSGGAYGIDGAAHAGALSAEAAPTVAVLACGVDVAYPRGHDRLLGRIAATGLVVSEVPPGVHPTRSRFLVRNRLIAALSLGTVVVEAALRSGSLSTAARADELSRPVMVVPGPVTSAASAGCHARLRLGALCVTSAQEVVEAIAPAGSGLGEPERGRADLRDDLPEVVRTVLDALPVRGAAGEASLARAAGVPVLVVQQVLPPLLVNGLVERVDGGYRLTALGAGRPAPAGRRGAGA
jgi:DNA processing protein